MGPLATFLGGPWLDDGIPSWPHESLLPPPDRFLSRCYAYLPRGILASTLYFTLARTSRINSSNLNTAFLSSLFQIFGILESTPTRTRSRFLSLSSLSLSGRIPAEMNNWNERIVRSQPLYRADVVGGLIASAVAANHGAFVSNRTGECVRIDKPYSPVRSIIHKSRQPGGCQRDKVVIVDQPRGERERERGIR